MQYLGTMLTSKLGGQPLKMTAIQVNVPVTNAGEELVDEFIRGLN